uniref:Uncharacterized protein n=1 Tax=Rhipicephalus zambeziensis TaxID=60191 RepID=A0A224YGG8_9ACAR
MKAHTVIYGYEFQQPKIVLSCSSQNLVCSGSFSSETSSASKLDQLITNEAFTVQLACDEKKKNALAVFLVHNTVIVTAFHCSLSAYVGATVSKCYRLPLLFNHLIFSPFA